MKCFIHPNHRDCPICGSSGDIQIEDTLFLIYCENCSAHFTDPKWADGPDENHEVTFHSFEDDSTAAEVMQELAGLKR